MHKVRIPCLELPELYVIGPKLHTGHDFFVSANSSNSSIDYLVFFDSRGISSQFEGSLAEHVINALCKSHKTYLMLCRPLEMTTWSALISFLENSQIHPRKIITNVGFVDFTPKKKETLDLSNGQCNSIFGKNVAEAFYVEHYRTKDGVQPIYKTRFGQDYKKKIELVTKDVELLVINSPVVSSKFVNSRRRPASFYSGITDGNEFNRSISRVEIIEIPTINEIYTYDGVHFTSEGNKFIFNLLKGKI